MLSWFYSAVVNSIVGIHAGVSHIFGRNSGWAWGLSIVLLVVAIRILLFPLFVKQIRTQRAMSELAPKIKELQQKYRGDRETLNTELMKLYREHNANPLGGCLPILIQFPIFIALFRVLNSFKPDHDGNFDSHYGISKSLVASAAQAKILGAPIASSFRSSSHTLHNLHASSGTVRLVTVALIVIMTATTFITQRQLIAKNSAAAGTPMAQQQKILLYVFPPMFALFGINFPVGVLLYWVTTNFWTMGQQFLVINRMHPPGTSTAGAKPTGKQAAGQGAGKAIVAGGGVSDPEGDAAEGEANDGAAAGTTGQSRPGAGSPPGRPANRNRKRKRNRRGGRR